MQTSKLVCKSKCVHVYIYVQVQKDIREGHAQTVDKVLGLLDSGGGVSGSRVCDAGCGTGSLAIPLALRVCI